MICEVCYKKPATDKHHKFSQTKANKHLYGELIHHPKNICYICNDCHMTKPIPKFTERQFCAALGISPRSKTEKMRTEHEAKNQEPQEP